MNREKSLSAFNKSKNLIPGGVNSPVRAFHSVNTFPVVIEKANGG